MQFTSAKVHKHSLLSLGGRQTSPTKSLGFFGVKSSLWVFFGVKSLCTDSLSDARTRHHEVVRVLAARWLSSPIHPRDARLTMQFQTVPQTINQALIDGP